MTILVCKVGYPDHPSYPHFGVIAQGKKLVTHPNLEQAVSHIRQIIGGFTEVEHLNNFLIYCRPSMQIYAFALPGGRNIDVTRLKELDPSEEVSLAQMLAAPVA